MTLNDYSEFAEFTDWRRKIETGLFLAILGCIICVLVFSQIGYWCALQIGTVRNIKSRFVQNQNSRRSVLDEISQVQKRDAEKNAPAWNGFRKFIVDRLVPEADQTTSVYLRPEDGRPLPEFLPGQHLTIRFALPSQAKPVVRCYSLSDRPRQDYFRITVKACMAPPNQTDLPPGLISNFVNHQLTENEIVDVKAPGGNFFLNLDDQEPVVLLAGGIGITPMLSMINTLMDAKSSRLILLVYAVQNSAQHAFKEHFRALEQTHPNLQVVTCYSDPLETDTLGEDYNFKGYASAGLLQQLLPNPDMQFYMCGPPPFMNSLYNGLIEWGAPDAQIHFESFGPASVKRVGELTDEQSADPEMAKSFAVKFARSSETIRWTGEYENLLELAEANGIALDSGCRAGNCGTCEIELLSGEVAHRDEDSVAANRCLACIATPKSDLELEA